MIRVPYPCVPILAALSLICATRVAAPSAQTARFFPVAVWYGGGKARAPMIESQARSKKEIWRKDVRQIKALGFNTLRAWIRLAWSRSSTTARPRR